MGNYTWVFKCVSNRSVSEPIVDIIEFIANAYKQRNWWFDDWMDTLHKSQKELVERAGVLRSEECKQLLLSDPDFPRRISMTDAMIIFNNRKFYGYVDKDLTLFLNEFGKCIPDNTFMMMLGIYEGFGPVALGWVNGKFVSMMGFEHRCFGGPDLLSDLKKTLDESLEGCDNDEEIINICKRQYRQMKDFQKEVLEPLDEVDWTDEEQDILSWLGRRGFEKTSQSTRAKENQLMGCAQQ